MDVCCGIVVVGIVIYVIIQIGSMKAAENERQQEICRKMEEQKYKEREARNKRFDGEKTRFDERMSLLFKQRLYAFLSYEEECSQLDKIIEEMKKIQQNSEYSSTIKSCSELVKNLRELGKRVNRLPDTRMLNADDYGKIQKKYWDSVRNLSKERVDAIVKENEQSISRRVYSKIVTIDIETALRCVWFYATEKPYSAEKFKKAVYVFECLIEKPHVDIAIAELYAMKQLGGEDSVREKTQTILKERGSDEKGLALIASALRWLDVYQSENMVLQHMLNKGMQMNAKMQERLHSLANGGGKAPGVFDVSSKKNELYFDVSTLAWKDAEYSGFFENLAFMERTLAYSLAIRDENKDLSITQGINAPEIGDILGKLITVFLSEYGNSVVVNMKNCIAVSGSGEEKMQGILIESKECEQLGILVYVARIGRRFNIKFYTLFMPNGDSIAKQKQQALSMYNKLSPSVTLWENSIKDTTLMAIQQLLNITPQNPVEADSSTVNNENPIF